MKTRHISALAAAFIVLPAHAAQPESTDDIETIIVSANAIDHKDSDAPYASETHTAEQIMGSGSTSLYDFLDKQTSLVVLPSFGNRYSQRIDMRGYGIGDGYQNIVVNLDGRRLNNIDMSPQLLGAIPLGSIDRIEIAKGSGSVVHGDGAMAGVINIYSKPQTETSFSVSAGNHGVFNLSAQGGVGSNPLDMNVYIDQSRQGGFSEADITGAKDEAETTSLMAKITIRPLDKLEMDINMGSTNTQNSYPGALTLAEYNANPAQNGGNVYSTQIDKTDNWGIGARWALTEDLELRMEHSQKERQSTLFVTNDYDYRSNRMSLNYRNGHLSLVAGGLLFDGERIGATEKTAKANEAIFLQADYLLGDTLLSAGIRNERIKYRYTPNTGARLQGNHHLNAWDIGLNHRINDQISLFTNYNQGFQAPDIDRFFNCVFDWATFTCATYVFNGFIEPAKSRTINAGVTYNGEQDKIKLTAFHSDLENEIYYDSFTFNNTNIDESHKFGLELQATHLFNESLSAHLNYAYTQAIIDKEDSGAGAYNGKLLPGVSPHTLSLGIDWQINPASHFSLSHTFRSEAYAAEDFTNSFSQKQEAYHSTDLSYRYQVRDQIAFFASVQNLFEQSNGIWVRDNAIYPVNFTRNWNLGIKVEL